MGERNNINNSALFTEKPEQWGLRGDPFLWKELQEKTENVQFLNDENKMREYLYGLFYELTGYEISSKEHIRVDRYFAYTEAGMSRGHVDSAWWLQEGFPLMGVMPLIQTPIVRVSWGVTGALPL